MHRVERIRALIGGNSHNRHRLKRKSRSMIENTSAEGVRMGQLRKRVHTTRIGNLHLR
jgi:hypothetical protein